MGPINAADRRTPADGSPTRRSRASVDTKPAASPTTVREKPSRSRANDPKPTARPAIVGGVAPNVGPPGRFASWRAAQRRGRQGFVPLSPGRVKRRHQILPRTVIGISTMLLAFAVGVGFSGAAFYAYYDHRLAQSEEQVARFVEGFDEQFTNAAGAIEEQRVAAIEEIREELGPLGEFSDATRGVVGLPQEIGGSVWTVETRDDEGQVVVGSAFSVAGHSGGSALVTTHSLIRAATLAPAPQITVVKGDRRLEATLWSWDEQRDVALLVVEEAIEPIEFAPAGSRSAALGQRVFALSGVGGLGASASPGTVIDQSEVGLQHTAVLGRFFEGGPLLDTSGRLLGVATSSYRPFGIDGGAVVAAPDVAALCATVLRCADAGETVVVDVDDGSAEDEAVENGAGEDEAVSPGD